MSTPIEVVRRYAALESQRLALEEEAAKIKTEQDAIREQVLSFFQNEGIDSVKTPDRTLYLLRRVDAGRAEGVSTEDCLTALQSRGWEDYAPRRVNWQGLSAVFREREAEGEEPVPEELRDRFACKESFRVGSRRR